MLRSPEGIEWSLAGGQDQTLLLEAGRASGSDGSNRFAGDYELDGERLLFRPLASTRTACDAEAIQAESDHLLALGRTARLVLTDQELILSDSQAPSCSGSPELPSRHERSPSWS